MCVEQSIGRECENPGELLDLSVICEMSVCVVGCHEKKVIGPLCFE
jgi:hypothetical protein